MTLVGIANIYSINDVKEGLVKLGLFEILNTCASDRTYIYDGTRARARSSAT
jgi:hypothetical protein